MKILAVSLILLAQVTVGSTCYEFYDSSAVQRKQGFVAKMRDALSEFTTSEFTQVCQAGISACSSTISSGAKTSAELAKIQALGLANAAGKLLEITTVYKALRFEITPSDVRDQIIVPISEIIKRGKDAAVKLELIDKGNLDPQSLIQKSTLEKLTFGLAPKTKKSNSEIIEELREQIDRTEVELWGQSYFSFAVATLIGGPKLTATYSYNAATGLISYKPGSGEKSMQDLAKALIIHRFQSSFKVNKDLAMIDRLRVATQDAMAFRVDQADVMAIKDIVLKEFGFDKLLTELDRDPKEEAQNLIVNTPTKSSEDISPEKKRFGFFGK